MILIGEPTWSSLGVKRLRGYMTYFSNFYRSFFLFEVFNVVDKLEASVLIFCIVESTWPRVKRL